MNRNHGCVRVQMLAKDLFPANASTCVALACSTRPSIGSDVCFYLRMQCAATTIYVSFTPWNIAKTRDECMSGSSVPEF